MGTIRTIKQYHQYISAESDNNPNISNSASQINSFSRSDNLLLTTRRAGGGIKILAPKQMVQRLPITLVQAKADSKSEKLLNEIRKTVYSKKLFSQRNSLFKEPRKLH